MSETLNKGMNYEIYPDRIVIVDENQRFVIPISRISCVFLALNTIYVEVEPANNSEKKCKYYVLKTDNLTELCNCLINLNIDILKLYTY
ncbi:MAG: hypothetical protein QXO71_05475 [Candidatus Jordarchaeaceae archaeon]